MSDILQEVSIPLCPKCSSKHFPHEACQTSAEEAVVLCSLCLGDHKTPDCPVLNPTVAWTPPDLPERKRHRRRLRRRRR